MKSLWLFDSCSFPPPIALQRFDFSSSFTRDSAVHVMSLTPPPHAITTVLILAMLVSKSDTANAIDPVTFLSCLSRSNNRIQGDNRLNLVCPPLPNLSLPSLYYVLKKDNERFHLNSRNAWHASIFMLSDVCLAVWNLSSIWRAVWHPFICMVTCLCYDSHKSYAYTSFSSICTKEESIRACLMIATTSVLFWIFSVIW